MPVTPTLKISAPAKINLFLHVTGRLPNGYHTLDSLVVFTDMGDEVHIEPADNFSFKITGPYARQLQVKETEHYIDHDNLVVKACRKLAQITNKPTNLRIKLIKNLPVASGIGGGSSDAAACLWGLCMFWDIPKDAPFLPPLMVSLGADVPVCFRAQTALMRGIGDRLEPAPDLPETPILLINPNIEVSTPEIFLRYNQAYKHETTLPNSFPTIDHLCDSMKRHENDLSTAAQQIQPVITNVLQNISLQENCRLSRMSGSGATCFGLFQTHEDADIAAKNISVDNPDWWIKTGTINTLIRY